MDGKWYEPIGGGEVTLVKKIPSPLEAHAWEAQWLHGYCARLRIERSAFEPWPRTLCCVLGQDT